MKRYTKLTNNLQARHWFIALALDRRIKIDLSKLSAKESHN